MEGHWQWTDSQDIYVSSDFTSEFNLLDITHLTSFLLVGVDHSGYRNHSIASTDDNSAGDVSCLYGKCHKCIEYITHMSFPKNLQWRKFDLIHVSYLGFFDKRVTVEDTLFFHPKTLHKIQWCGTIIFFSTNMYVYGCMAYGWSQKWKYFLVYSYRASTDDVFLPFTPSLPSM